MSFRTVLPVVLCAVALGVSSPSVADTPGNSGGLFVVADALTQFDALKHHAEALAWRNPEALGAPDPSLFDHYQGLARNPRTGIAPVFYVSQLDDDDGGLFTGHGYLHVVQFGSRTTTGERLRSNLQQNGNDTEEDSPPPSDTWLHSIRFDGTLLFDGVPLPAYKHPGSMALVDDVLFLPVDQPFDDHAPTGHLLMFDVVDPTNPVPLQALPLSHSIDNVGVTRLPDDTWLIWANGGGGDDIKVYRTSTTSLRDNTLDLILVQNWEPGSGLAGDFWPDGIGAHQSSTFLHDAAGTLHMIGMRHADVPGIVGPDYVDLYRVDVSPSYELFLTPLRTRELHCVYDGGGGPLDMRVCNMAASNNAYVSPTGELILYSIPHDDEDGFDTDIVRMGEFRHVEVNREGSPLRAPGAEAGGPYAVGEGLTLALSGSAVPAADRPWVELYDDKGFGDRSIVIDYDDRALFELSDFDDLDDFGDKTSAVRWRSPVGLDIELFDDHDFSDRRIVLKGTGKTEEISDLDDQVVIPGVVEHYNPTRGAGEALGFSDKTSSARWTGTESPEAFTYVWDLDGDASFGETGAAAARGDETGATPTFSALALDGPLALTVSLHVSTAGVEAVGADVADLNVNNVPPTVSITSIDGGFAGLGLIGLPVKLTGSYSDIALDTHTAEVDWADGFTGAATVHAALSTVDATHVYTTAGDYSVQLRVTDDDNGTGTASIALTVHDASSAVTSVLEAIDALLAGSLSAKDRAALQQARDALDGQDGGHARDGALDKLAVNDPVAALAMLEKAILALDNVTGTDVSSLKRLLSLAANSVARSVRERAATLFPPGNVATALANVDVWLTTGETKQAAAAYVEAVTAFRQAVARALPLLRRSQVPLASGVMKNAAALPTRFDLQLAGASPARDRVTLRLAIPTRSAAEVGVFDLRGALVRTLAAESFDAGWHTLEWDLRDPRGRDVAAGVYFLALRAGRERVTLRVPVVR
jgi:hypothetical protein